MMNITIEGFEDYEVSDGVVWGLISWDARKRRTNNYHWYNWFPRSSFVIEYSLIPHIPNSVEKID